MAINSLKLLYLWQILMEETDEEHGLTITEFIYRLAEKGIKVTAQTLRLDISTLRHDKMDILIDHKGKNTTYRVVHRDLSLAEIKMICDCIDSSRSISEKQSNILKQKLGMMCSKHERKEKEHELFMSAHPKTSNEKIFYNIDAIHLRWGRLLPQMRRALGGSNKHVSVVG